MEATHATYQLNHYAFVSPGYTGAALTNALAASNRMGYACATLPHPAVQAPEPLVSACDSLRELYVAM